MTAFFYRKASKKWTWKSPNGQTKNEIDFILINKLNAIKNVTVLSKLKSGDQRMVRCKDLKREREKLFRIKRSNIPTSKRSQMNLRLKSRMSI